MADADPILIMRISMDHGTADLVVPRGAKPLDLALQFCSEQKLPAGSLF